MSTAVLSATGRISIEDHLGLVKHVANRYQRRGLDFEELTQEGVFGLIEAARRFDATRGVQFSTYAFHWIRQAMLLALTKHLRETAQTLSLEEPLPFAEGEDDALCLGDLLEAPDPWMPAEQQFEVADLLHYLSQEERRVIERRYQLGQEGVHGIEEIPLPYAEVARQVKRTAEHVKTVEERALRKMYFWATRPFREG